MTVITLAVRLSATLSYLTKSQQLTPILLAQTSLLWHCMDRINWSESDLTTRTLGYLLVSIIWILGVYSRVNGCNCKSKRFFECSVTWDLTNFSFGWHLFAFHQTYINKRGLVIYKKQCFVLRNYATLKLFSLLKKNCFPRRGTRSNAVDMGTENL